MSRTILALRNISKSINNAVILHAIDLDMQEGEFLVILGPTGSGKTTLFNLIAGFLQPTAGDIIIAEKNMTMSPPKERPINTIFRSYALFPHLSVFENIAFGLRCQKLKAHDINERVIDMLKQVNLTEEARKKPGVLDRAAQFRLALARALVNQPLILLLDQPFAPLDYCEQQAMHHLLKTLQKQLKFTCLLATDNPQEAMLISDRIMDLHKGCMKTIPYSTGAFSHFPHLQNQIVGQITHLIKEANTHAITIELTIPKNQQSETLTLQQTVTISPTAARKNA